jgi:hypothetical protein
MQEQMVTCTHAYNKIWINMHAIIILMDYSYIIM